MQSASSVRDGSVAGYEGQENATDEVNVKDEMFYFNSLPKMPQGVKESVDAVGPALAMPVISAICPAIGMLATGVKVAVHGKMNSLNLISYIAGDFASGKGSIDPVIGAWTSEVKEMDKMYQQKEDEWRAKKRAAKNKKEQPEEPKLPVRCLTLNNTVANLAERLANTAGKTSPSTTACFHSTKNSLSCVSCSALPITRWALPLLITSWRLTNKREDG